MRKVVILFSLVSSQICFSQNWVDTTFQISTISNIDFGNAIDFKGEAYNLKMDISFPVDDTPPECGRPLMVVVHGGAWYGGDKAVGYSVSFRNNFAKRGYVTASVNYRQGLFNTNQNIDCVLLEGWKCWNMTDSIEWYRANYRAIQDVRGAIRYLVNEQETYTINPDNIFLVGESAGGFVAMGAGFLDDQSEVLDNLVDEYPDALAPHSTYESDCIQQFDLANSIAEMDLSRPALGDFEGDNNFPVQEEFRIRGVGSYFGGAFNNIFETKSSDSPALYLYHQPCDLIVPFAYNKLLAGYSTCATGFPTFCQPIINRPSVFGSNAIVSLIDNMTQNNIPTCEYFFDNSANSYTCLEQVANPSIGCHAIDNEWLRTTNMATFFAEKIASCSATNTIDLHKDDELEVSIYPNPLKGSVQIKLNASVQSIRIRIIDIFGKVLIDEIFENQQEFSLDTSTLSRGYYQFVFESKNTKRVYPIIKTE